MASQNDSSKQQVDQFKMFMDLLIGHLRDGENISMNDSGFVDTFSSDFSENQTVDFCGQESENMTHKCSECPKGFQHARDLECHFLAHHEKMYIWCRICREEFNLPENGDQLVAHLMTHGITFGL